MSATAAAARWTLRAPDPALVAGVARRHALPEVVASVLVARGHADPAAAEAHLRASPMGLHDPALLPGMEAATQRLARAVRDGETVLVHGDYDVDGVTGTVLLVRAIRALGGRALWHVPNRLVDGYSFGDHSIARAVECGARVVVSVDNGTSAHGPIAALNERGIDVVVTDHHEPPDGPLPAAAAIVNPKLPGSTYPWRELCGGGVAFKLAWGLARAVSGSRRVGEEMKRFLEEAMGLVAIATVCDVVPLLDENRILARAGIRSLATTSSPGIRAVLEAAGIAGRPLTAEDVGFQIGPRINASGRLGSAASAVECLLADEAGEARRLARLLEEKNAERKRIEADVLASARVEARRFADTDEWPALVLAGEGWHQGVVGIVAARLAEEHGRPAIVIGLDGAEGRGSARAAGGISVLELLRAGAGHLARYGGHEQAAGCEIRARDVPALRSAACARARELLAEASAETPALSIDCELDLASMDETLMREIERLEPFGPSNEAPVLLSRAVSLAEPPREVGRDGGHLMLRLRRGARALRAMGFRLGARLPELRLGRPIDAVYTPRWNAFRGETRLELVLHDFRPAS